MTTIKAQQNIYFPQLPFIIPFFLQKLQNYKQMKSKQQFYSRNEIKLQINHCTRKHYIFRAYFPRKQTKHKEENGPCRCGAFQMIDQRMTSANSETLASVSVNLSLRNAWIVWSGARVLRAREGKRRGALYWEMRIAYITVLIIDGVVSAWDRLTWRKRGHTANWGWGTANVKGKGFEFQILVIIPWIFRFPKSHTLDFVGIFKFWYKTLSDFLNAKFDSINHSKWPKGKSADGGSPIKTKKCGRS